MNVLINKNKNLLYLLAQKGFDSSFPLLKLYSGNISSFQRAQNIRSGERKLCDIFDVNRMYCFVKSAGAISHEILFRQYFPALHFRARRAEFSHRKMEGKLPSASHF